MLCMTFSFLRERPRAAHIAPSYWPTWRDRLTRTDRRDQGSVEAVQLYNRRYTSENGLHAMH